ncbi:hypothetical protein V5O48_005292 [Marasmius crinis-equi]|uniref:Uncharacterized protein n=1 Tax=Marasmius crinis-equi TaxID=585013 RepID=A0ABR3FN51_9AGAR
MENNVALIIAQVEKDWDSYEGVTVDDSPLDSPVEDIKEGFEKVLAFSDEEIMHLFRSWKAAIDSDLDGTPHLLAALLEGNYRKIPEFSRAKDLKPGHQYMNASLLQEPDRRILAKFAPFAKAYGFDIHLGQAQYLEFGFVELPLGVKDEEYITLDPDTAEFAYDATGEDSKEELTVQHVFSLDGIPMNLKAKDLNEPDAYNLGYEPDRHDVPDIFINGFIADGPKVSKIEPVDDNGVDGPFLIRTWTRRVLLLSPRNSTRTQITLRLESNQWFHHELKFSLSSFVVPCARDLRLVEALLKWLEQETSKPGASREPIAKLQNAATLLVHRARCWYDLDIMTRVVRACTSDTIAIIGPEKLASAYQTFKGDIKAIILQAIETEASQGLHYEVVEKLRIGAQGAQDIALSAWCDEELGTAFGGISKLDVAGVSVIAKRAKEEPNPSLALRDMIQSKFGPVLYSDAHMWKILFKRLAEESTSDSSVFDKAVLPQIVQQCLQRISEELWPFVEAKHSSSLYSPARAVKHVVVFVELCLDYNVTDLPAGYFRRMKKEAAAYSPARHNSAHAYYADLVEEFHCLTKARPEAQTVLAPFFVDAVMEMLPHSSDYGISHSRLKTACLYLDRPSKVFQEWWLNQGRAKKAMTQNQALAAAERFIEIIRNQDRPQNVLMDECFYILRLFVEDAIDRFDPNLLLASHGRQSALDVVKLCRSVDDPRSIPLISRLLVRVLGTPGQVVHIRDGLVPFMKEIQGLLQSHKQSLMDQPYSEFAAEVVMRWISSILRSRPFPEFALEDFKVGCDCELCAKRLAQLFGGGNPEQKKFKMDVSHEERDHLVGELSKIQKFGVSWKVVSVGYTKTVGKPVKLQVERTPKLMQVFKWSKRQAEAQKLFEGLGTLEEQQKIMGSRYGWAKESVAGNRLQTKAANQPTTATLKRSLESTATPQDGRNDNSKRQRVC